MTTRYVNDKPQAPSPENASPAQAGVEDAKAASAFKPAPDEHPQAIGPLPQCAVPLGLSLPPLEEAFAAAGHEEDQASAPSPYSANRALVHDLTLPAVPNLDIPPSPPGSPPLRASSKFEQFLALKGRGTHFNAKLEQSTTLRNPGVTDKLMDFVELDGPEQYETTLPPDLWDPRAFPESAFVERLRKIRDRIAKEREADRAGGGRSSIVFVPSTTPSVASASTAGGLAKGDKRRGGWK